MKFRLSPGVVVLSALLFVVPAFAQQDSKSTTDDSAPSAKQATPDQKAETPTQESPAAKPSSSTQTSTPAPADPTAKTPSDPTASAPSDPTAKTSAGADGKDTPLKKEPTVIAQPDDSKVKHDGSKNDVNAIGNRKVGGRGLGDWYSLEGEIRMGKQYAQEVEATSKLTRDPVITE